MLDVIPIRNERQEVVLFLVSHKEMSPHERKFFVDLTYKTRKSEFLYIRYLALVKDVLRPLSIFRGITGI